MRAENVESRIEDWTPGGQAELEQGHAEAIERLRGASMFLLVWVNDDDEVERTGEVGGMRCWGAGEPARFAQLCVATSDAARRLWALLVERYL